MQKTTLKIDGMACSMCEAHINDCIRQNFDIKKIKTSHVKRESVVISENPLDVEKLKRVISETGYTLVSADAEQYEKKGLFSR